MFSLTGDNDVIVYVTAGGKMECVARADGTSRWLYAFPTVVFPMPPRGRTPAGLVPSWFAPESVFSFGPFFVDRVAARGFVL